MVSTRPVISKSSTPFNNPLVTVPRAPITVGKIEKELETLIHTIRIYSQDIGMEFGIEKCALLVMKSGKRHLTDGIELPRSEHS